MIAEIATLRRTILDSNINYNELLVGQTNIVVAPCTREVFGAVKEMVRDLHLDNKLWVERTDWNFFTVKMK